MMLLKHPFTQPMHDLHGILFGYFLNIKTGKIWMKNRDHEKKKKVIHIFFLNKNKFLKRLKIALFKVTKFLYC